VTGKSSLHRGPRCEAWDGAWVATPSPQQKPSTSSQNVTALNHSPSLSVHDIPGPPLPATARISTHFPHGNSHDFQAVLSEQEQYPWQPSATRRHQHALSTLPLPVLARVSDLFKLLCPRVPVYVVIPLAVEAIFESHLHLRGFRSVSIPREMLEQQIAGAMTSAGPAPRPEIGEASQLVLEQVKANRRALWE